MKLFGTKVDTGVYTVSHYKIKAYYLIQKSDPELSENSHIPYKLCNKGNIFYPSATLLSNNYNLSLATAHSALCMFVACF